MSERKIAVSIARCEELEFAKTDDSHPCSSVVREQDNTSDRHLPEPWFGNLENSKVLFISSNPSIDLNPGMTGENYPRASWSDEDIAEWFIRRVDQTWNMVPVSFRHPVHKSFLWRCIDGQYRGANPSGRTPQQSWNRTHGVAVELLGPIADPSQNWALTEVVHCKSRDAQGVSKALPMCTTKWLSPILQTAKNANVMVLAGREVRDGWARMISDVPKDFGIEVKKDVDDAQLMRALNNSFVSTFGHRRLVTYMRQPSVANKFTTWYGPEITHLFAEIAQQVIPVPQTTFDLHQLMRDRFS
jgi:hypothetical protein